VPRLARRPPAQATSTVHDRHAGCQNVAVLAERCRIDMNEPLDAARIADRAIDAFSASIVAYRCGAGGTVLLPVICGFGRRHMSILQPRRRYNVSIQAGPHRRAANSGK